MDKFNKLEKTVHLQGNNLGKVQKLLLQITTAGAGFSLRDVTMTAHSSLGRIILGIHRVEDENFINLVKSSELEK